MFQFETRRTMDFRQGCSWNLCPGIPQLAGEVHLLRHRRTARPAISGQPEPDFRDGTVGILVSCRQPRSGTTGMRLQTATPASAVAAHPNTGTVSKSRTAFFALTQ